MRTCQGTIPAPPLNYRPRRLIPPVPESPYLHGSVTDQVCQWIFPGERAAEGPARTSSTRRTVIKDGWHGDRQPSNLATTSRSGTSAGWRSHGGVRVHCGWAIAAGGGLVTSATSRPQSPGAPEKARNTARGARISLSAATESARGPGFHEEPQVSCSYGRPANADRFVSR